MLANCPECGKLFNRVRERICPTCVEAENVQFATVRDHMREHPVTTATQLADETNVPRELILKWVDEGRLDLTRTEAERDGCKRCGRPAEHGDLCNRCKGELAQQIAEVRSAASPSQSATGAGVPKRSDGSGMYSRGS